MLLYTRESHRSVLKFPSCPRTQHCDHSSVTLDDVSASTHTHKPMTLLWAKVMDWEVPPKHKHTDAIARLVLLSKVEHIET